METEQDAGAPGSTVSAAPSQVGDQAGLQAPLLGRAGSLLPWPDLTPSCNQGSFRVHRRDPGDPHSRPSLAPHLLGDLGLAALPL